MCLSHLVNYLLLSRPQTPQALRAMGSITDSIIFGQILFRMSNFMFLLMAEKALLALSLRLITALQKLPMVLRFRLGVCIVFCGLYGNGVYVDRSTRSSANSRHLTSDSSRVRPGAADCSSALANLLIYVEEGWT